MWATNNEPYGDNDVNNYQLLETLDSIDSIAINTITDYRPTDYRVQITIKH